MSAARGFDWPGLMRAGLRGLRLRPAEFWALTPAELAMMLGIEAAGGMTGGMSRKRLAELMGRFPDGGSAPARPGRAGFPRDI